MVQFTRIIKVVGEHWCQNFDLFFSGVSASEVITDRLEAKSAFIEQLQVSKPIVTQRGDIAYHFKLDAADHDLPLEEGDIVGVIEGPDGKSHIEKLTHFNASKATMAGVISRSAYLEAKTPAEEENKGTNWNGSAPCLSILRPLPSVVYSIDNRQAWPSDWLNSNNQENSIFLIDYQLL